MCEKLTIDGFRKDRSMPNNYYGDFLGQNMMQFQITEDMPLEKKLWRTYKHIWLGGE